SGEQDPEINAILRACAESRGARFVDVSVPQDEYVPGIESVSILDRVLLDTMGVGLEPREREARLAKLRAHFRWSPSARAGVEWFNGAEINDIDSTLAILRYLDRESPRPVTFLAYFRKDRRDRTASFVTFFEEVAREGLAEHVFLAGAGANVVARRLRAHRGLTTLLDDGLDTVEESVRRVLDRASGGRVMTVANAVPPWPRAASQLLSGTSEDVYASASRMTDVKVLAAPRRVPVLAEPARRPLLRRARAALQR
ncbi:MAG TPA: hypothetical protein VM582_03155, partial [Candidatus Thermoplasmatota archaeon]|nr:hypothetical protein [Candidatus Thermoplasmatota archaeon]